MDIQGYNRIAWNNRVEDGKKWTVPVSSRVVESARRGHWKISLTSSDPIPREWFPIDLKGLDILCLASGGGQQAPILAATGAKITVLDNSPKQLEQDRFVARRDSLLIDIVEGDMTDLSIFPDECFNIVINPCSSSFISDVRPVWLEAFRVLRHGGILMTGFLNPVVFIFDEELTKQNILKVRFTLPYSDLTSLTKEERQKYIDKQEPLAFSHTLADLIGGQLKAGFLLTDLREASGEFALAQYMPTLIHTRAIKP